VSDAGVAVTTAAPPDGGGGAPYAARISAGSGVPGVRRAGGVRRDLLDHAAMLDMHEERFRRILTDYLERPAGDYAELLHRGQVSSPEGVDTEAWREQIRRQARQDKIRVITRRDGARAFAVLNPSVADERAGELMQRALARGLELQRLAQTARELGHKPIGWLRSDDEYVSVCSSCGARIYRGAATPPTRQQA